MAIVIQLFESKSKIEEANKKIKNLNLELDELRKNYSCLNNQFIEFQDNILNSRSWKLTKPLRTIGNYFKKP